MRRLAPMFVFTTIAALAGGTAFATTTGTTTAKMSATDKSGAPTVDANTNTTQGMSYSDKSGTSPGTNARIDGKPSSMATNQTDERVITKSVDEDDKSMTEQKTAAEKKAATKMKKAKVARAGDSTMMNRTPVTTSNGAAANSTTGSSAGQ